MSAANLDKSLTPALCSTPLAGCLGFYLVLHKSKVYYVPEDGSEPAKPIDAPPISAIAGYRSQYLILGENGTVLRWNYGESPFSPTLSSTLSSIIAVRAGYHHMIALSRDGTVYQFDIREGYDSTFKKVDNLPPVENIDCFGFMAAAISKKGELFYWGANSKYLGGFDSTTPVRIEWICPGDIAILGSGAHVRRDGNVYYGVSHVSVINPPRDIVHACLSMDMLYMLTSKGDVYSWDSTLDEPAKYIPNVHCCYITGGKTKAIGWCKDGSLVVLPSQYVMTEFIPFDKIPEPSTYAPFEIRAASLECRQSYEAKIGEAHIGFKEPVPRHIEGALDEIAEKYRKQRDSVSYSSTDDELSTCTSMEHLLTLEKLSNSTASDDADSMTTKSIAKDRGLPLQEEDNNAIKKVDTANKPTVSHKESVSTLSLFDRFSEMNKTDFLAQDEEIIPPSLGRTLPSQAYLSDE